jgi:hypothetical protein
MATVKQYVTSLWGMQTQIAKALGCDLQFSSLELRALLLSVDIALGIVLQALTSATVPVTTDAALQQAMNNVLNLGWLEQAAPIISDGNTNPPLNL